MSSTATFAQLVCRFQAAGASMSLSAPSASAYCSTKPGSFGSLATAIGALSSTRSTPGAARRRSRSASSVSPSPTLTAAARISRRRNAETTARIADRTSLVGVEHAAAELDEQPGGRPRLAARTRVTVGAEANPRRGGRRGEESEDDGRNGRLAGPSYRRHR